MKEILEISYMTKKKAKVLFDGGSSFVLYAGELKKFGWSQGDQIDDEQYKAVREETVLKRAKLYALHLLQDQDRTEKDLTDKILGAGYDADIAKDALTYVKGYGYVDDARYASNYVLRFKGVKSVRSIRQELKKRGIDGDTIEDALADSLSEEDEHSAVARLLKKRRFSPAGAGEDPKEAARQRDKQLRYMASKGFSYSSVKYVMEHWEEFEE